MAAGLSGIESLSDLARALRHLRRREARRREGSELTYRELAAKTGWSVGVIGEYFTGKILPPTDRFDALIRMLGATPAEQGMLATARDRIAEGRRGKPAAAERPAVPRQLPADVLAFAGRAGALAELDALLAARRRAVMIAAVSGTAGIGKTTLALHWAHRVAGQFPDGQLYVNLRGFDPAGAPMKATDVLRGFLIALGQQPDRIPAGQEEQAALFRSLLADKRMLVLLDNAADAAHVRPLLPGSPRSVVVVTSRNHLTGLVATGGAHAVSLGLLSTMEARELLAGRLGADRVAAEPGAVDEIIERCVRLPIALAVAAARAAADRHLSLDRLAASLTSRLDALDVGDAAADVRAVFSWSYQRLHPNVAELFRMLGLHPGPDFEVSAAASLVGVPAVRTQLLLAELVRVHLLVEHKPGRYTFHDLLRAYAAELTLTHVGAAERQSALRRMFDQYVRDAQHAALWLDPARELAIVDHPQAGGPGSHQEALAWFTVEHEVLIASVTLAADNGFDAQACELAWAIGGFLQRRGNWQDWAGTEEIALAAARRRADRSAEARILRELAGAYVWLGRHDEAEAHLHQALDGYGELGDDIGRSRTHRNMCLLYERQGRYPQALDHARRSRDLLLPTDDQAGKAYAYNSVGWYHALVGDFEAALVNCEQAIVLLREVGDRVGEATTWDSLGYAHHHLGHYGQAVECYQRALDLFRDGGDRYYEADTLNHLGDTHRETGDHRAAREAWRQAVAILERLQHPEAAEVRAKLS
jgi:tetratricopeptide (TPR) repeat protein